MNDYGFRRAVVAALACALLASGVVVGQSRRARAAPPADLTDQEFERLWAAVGHEDYATAYAAMHRLAAEGDAAVAPMARQVQEFQQATKVDDKGVRKLIGDLDADQYAVRSRAAAQIALLGGWALPHLRTASEKTTSPEARARLEELIRTAENPSAGPVQRKRLARAARLLGWIDTDKANALLKTIQSCPAAPAADEIDEAAWGPAADDLQAGLCYEFGRRPYRQGEIVPLVLKVRNIGAKAVTLSHPRVPQFVNWENYGKSPTPQVFDAQGALVGPDGPLAGTGIATEAVRQTVGPGQTVTIGRVPLPVWSSNSAIAMMVNVLPFKPKPGPHKVSVTWTFTAGKDGDWKGTLPTALLGVDVVAADQWIPALPEEPEAGWGPPVEGIQCRAIVDRAILEAGQPPVVQVDARSVGGTVQQFVERGPFGVQVEVDGKLLPLSPSFGGLMRTNPDLPPGGLVARIPEMGPPLEPGRHILRALFAGQAYSLPVEVRVRPKGQDPAAPQPATVPAPKAPVQCRLTADRPAWLWWQTPGVTVVVRNPGDKEVAIQSVRLSFDRPRELREEHYEKLFDRPPVRLAPAASESIPIPLEDKPCRYGPIKGGPRPLFAAAHTGPVAPPAPEPGSSVKFWDALAARYGTLSMSPGRYVVRATVVTDVGESESPPAEFTVLPPGVGTLDEVAKGLRRYDGLAPVEAGFVPEATEVVWGEPLVVTFVVRNLSRRRFSESFRWRPAVQDEFQVDVTDANGVPLPPWPPPDPSAKGFLIDEVSVPAGEMFARPLRLDARRLLPGPGTYQVTCRFGHVPIETTYTLTIRPRTEPDVRRVMDRLLRQAGGARGSALAAALETLCEFAGEAAVPALVEMAAKGDLEHRAAALRDLGRFATDAAVDTVLATLRDADATLRLAAETALGRMRTDPAVAALAARLPKLDNDVALRVLRALGRSGCPGALKSLETAMAAKQFPMREAAANALHEFNTPESIAILRRYGADSDLDFRAIVVEHLWHRRAAFDPKWIVPIVRARIGTTKEVNGLCFILYNSGAQAELMRCLDLDDPSTEALHNNTVLFQGMRADGDVIVDWIGAPEWAYGKGKAGTPEQVEHNRRALLDVIRWLEAYDTPGYGPATVEGALDGDPKSFAAPEWSEPTAEKLRVRLRAPIQQWRHGETPCLVVDIFNGGDKPFEYLDRPAQYCQVECDGAECSWIPPPGSRTVAPPACLPPGKVVYGSLMMPLSQHLRRADGTPFSLGPGAHKIRIAFAPRAAEGVTRVWSNPATIEIVAAPEEPASQPTTAPAWGATVDRTLYAYRDQWDLDLDSNEASRPDPEGKGGHRRGADVYTDFTSMAMPITVAPDMKVWPIAAGWGASLEPHHWEPGWKNDSFGWGIAPALLLERAAAPSGPAPGRLARVDSHLPRTFIVKTAGGKVGVLQVVYFLDAPRGVRLRYKLLSK